MTRLIVGNLGTGGAIFLINIRATRTQDDDEEAS